MGIRDTAAAAVTTPVTWGVIMVVVIGLMGSALAITGGAALNLFIEKQNDLWSAQRKANDGFNDGLREMVRAITVLAEKQIGTDQKATIANVRLDAHERDIQRIQDGR
jgi:hypothetical protein